MGTVMASASPIPAKTPNPLMKPMTELVYSTELQDLANLGRLANVNPIPIPKIIENKRIEEQVGAVPLRTAPIQATIAPIPIVFLRPTLSAMMPAGIATSAIMSIGVLNSKLV